MDDYEENKLVNRPPTMQVQQWPEAWLSGAITQRIARHLYALKAALEAAPLNEARTQCSDSLNCRSRTYARCLPLSV